MEKRSEESHYFKQDGLRRVKIKQRCKGSKGDSYANNLGEHQADGTTSSMVLVGVQ